MADFLSVQIRYSVQKIDNPTLSSARANSNTDRTSAVSRQHAILRVKFQCPLLDDHLNVLIRLLESAAETRLRYAKPRGWLQLFLFLKDPKLAYPIVRLSLCKVTSCRIKAVLDDFWNTMSSKSHGQSESVQVASQCLCSPMVELVRHHGDSFTTRGETRGDTRWRTSIRFARQALLEVFSLDRCIQRALLELLRYKEYLGIVNSALGIFRWPTAVRKERKGVSIGRLLHVCSCSTRSISTFVFDAQLSPASQSQSSSRCLGNELINSTLVACRSLYLSVRVHVSVMLSCLMRSLCSKFPLCHQESFDILPCLTPLPCCLALPSPSIAIFESCLPPGLLYALPSPFTSEGFVAV